MNKLPSKFYHHTFHSLFEYSESLAIALEIQRLCTDIPAILNEFNTEKRLLLKIAEHQINIANQKHFFEPSLLTETYKKIAKKSLIEELLIGAFLCTDCSFYQPEVIYIDCDKYFSGDVLSEDVLSKSEHYEQLTNFKRLLLFSGYRLLHIDNSKSKLEIMLREFRRFCLGKRHNTQHYYLLIDVVGFENLDLLKNKMFSHGKWDKYRQDNNYLFPYASGIGLALYNKPSYQEEVFIINSKKPRKKEISSQVKSPKDITTQASINFSTSSASLDRDMTRHETKKILYISKYSRTDRKPRYQQTLVNKEKNKSMSSRKRRLPCDGTNAHPDAIRNFLQYSGSWRGNEKTAVELLLWSLYLGKRLVDLAFSINNDQKFIRYNYEQKGYEINYQLDLPQPEFDDSELKRHRVDYSICLPQKFNRIFHTFLEIDKYLPILKKILGQFNRSHNVYLTVNNIGDYMGNYLINNGVSKNLIQLLTDPNQDHQVPLYYTSINSDLLYQTHQNYINHLNEDTQDFAVKIINHENYLLGSKIIISKENIQEIFDTLAWRIEANKDVYHRHDEGLHNAFTLHLFLLLSMANGYRPVNQAQGYIADYDLATGLCFISDKERSQKVEGRINYLGKTACTQISSYMNFCRSQYLYYQQKQRVLATRYKQVLNSEESLLFFYENGKLLAFTPSNLKAQFKKYQITLPLNWSRHYVRTVLFENNYPDQIMNAWSGHDDDGQIPFSKYSAISTQDLRGVADFLDEHFNELGIKIHKIYVE